MTPLIFVAGAHFTDSPRVVGGAHFSLKKFLLKFKMDAARNTKVIKNVLKSNAFNETMKIMKRRSELSKT